MGTKVVLFNPSQWAECSARVIQSKIEYFIDQLGFCNVMLTGGASAEALYKSWSSLPNFQMLKSVNFYFGDERCVLPSSKRSNYGMAMRTLFQNGIPDQCSVFRINGEARDIADAAAKYLSCLPDKVDLLLLGVGLDGHIASLFPGSNLLSVSERLVSPVKYLSDTFNRVTITPEIIRGAKSCFVLAPGSEKLSILSKALSMPDQPISMPASLVLDATWLMDAS